MRTGRGRCTARIGRTAGGASDTWTTRTFADDAAVVLEACDIDLAHVYGHSMGGRVAQRLAVDHPEVVDRLVLASTTGGDRLDRPRAPGVDAALTAGDTARMAPLFFTEAFRQDHPEAVELFFVRDAPLRVRRRHFEASRSHDAWDDLHRIVAPTLVLHGADDPVTSPDSGISLALRIPTADLLLVPDQLHCPHLESADGADAVLDFLADG